MSSQSPADNRVASQLLDLLRGAGLSRGSRLAFSLAYAAWGLADSPGGRREWGQLVGAPESGEADALAVLVPDARELREFTSALPEHTVRRALELIDGVLAADGQDGVRDLAESLLETQAASGSRQGGEYATPAWLARLMADLVSPAESALDPAVGMGSCLMALAERGARVMGVDVNEDVVQQAQARLTMARASSQVRRGDSLEGASGLEGPVDAVVVVPPFGMLLSDGQRAGLEAAGVPEVFLRGREQRTGLFWLHLAAHLLKPGGRAAVVLASSSTFAGPGLEHLMLEGVIEGLISLPASFALSTSITGQLWLVRAPGEAPGRMLFADASPLAETMGRARRSVLSDSASDTLTALVSNFRQGYALDVPGYVAKTLPRHDVLLDRGITPARYLDEVPERVEVLPEPSGHLLTGLTIEGYKSFRDRTELPLAPLTVVYGPNSSGKSSLIQSLLLLKQSMGQPHLVTQGDVTDVGSFTGIRNRHETPTVRFSVDFGAPVWDLPVDGTPDPTCPRHLEFDYQDKGDGRGSLQASVVNAGPLQTSWVSAEPGTMSMPAKALAPVFGHLGTGTFLYPLDTRHDPHGDDEEAARTRSERNRKRAEGYARKLARSGVERFSIDWDGTAASGRASQLPAIHASEREASVLQSYLDRTARLVAGPGHELRTILSDLVYLGPLRSAPQRFYSRTTTAGLPGDGRDAVLYLYDHESAMDQVNEWFRRLEIPYEIGIVPLVAGQNKGLVGDLVAVSLKDLRSGVTVTPADVGYGVSQSMPLVVELTARTRSVICIEQPETHLHPRLQARLAELLIDATKVEDRANQVIVETHSEHLMLRLQRRIREGDLNRDDLCVLYVDQDEEGSARVQRLRVDEDGDFIDEWPDGFFDERMEELFGGLA